MPEITSILMPQINVNDETGFLNEWAAVNGAYVNEGDVLAEIETSKSVEELKAPCSGYFFAVADGLDSYKIGTELAVISSTADYQPKQGGEPSTQAVEQAEKNVIMTQKARALVEKMKMDLSLLPQGVLLKEKDILKLTQQEEKTREDDSALYQALEKRIADFRSASKDLTRAILICGAGTTAKIVLDTLRLLPEYEIFGIVDYHYTGGKQLHIMGVPVIGPDSEEVLTFLFQNGITKACNSVASLNQLRAREAVYQKLKKVGFDMPPIVHPRAFVETSAHLEEGVFVHANAYIGSDTQIGHNSFINTSAIVSHDCKIGASVFCAPNATIAGIVTIGDCSLIGMCATLLSRTCIGQDVTITNNSRVFGDVKDHACIK